MNIFLILPIRTILWWGCHGNKPLLSVIGEPISRIAIKKHRGNLWLITLDYPVKLNGNLQPEEGYLLEPILGEDPTY